MPKKPTVDFRKVTDLTPDPRNARTHSPEQIEAVANSIRRFGWTNPILADDMIRAGHGRLAAALLIYGAGERIFLAPGQRNGGAEVPDGHVPVMDCTGWSDAERRAYALADNQLALQADWDDEALRKEIEALTSMDIDLDLTGFTTSDIEALFNTGGDSPEEFPEFDEEIETEHKCPKCGYAWSGKAS